MKKISISQIKEVAQQAYEQVKGNTDGKNADYIPYLANIYKNLFGISICLLNGQKITIGDYNYRFGIESVSKVHTAILVLRQYGAQKILDMIGADATGLPFNSIIAILLENDHPSTPLVVGYGDALWWAFMDVTTVGSNIIAVTATGRVLSVLLAALGMMMFPIFTVYVTSLIQKKNKEKDEYYEQLASEKQQQQQQQQPVADK